MALPTMDGGGSLHTTPRTAAPVHVAARKPAKVTAKPAPKPIVKPKAVPHQVAPIEAARVATPKPSGSPLRPAVLPGHDAGPKPVGFVSGSIPGGSTTRPPVLPGHEAGPQYTPGKTVTATPPRPTTDRKPTIIRTAPVNTVAKPKPARAPAKPAPKPIVQPKTPTAVTPTATNSSAPIAVSAGGFDLASLLPILLIAGAVLAGLYLYTHHSAGSPRKKGA